MNPQVPVAPSRSRLQRLEALSKANAVRIKRSALKKEMKKGNVNAHSVLLATPDWAEEMKLFDLMLAVPKFGRVKVNKILAQCRISPSKTIAGLSDRQRAEVAARLLRR